MARPRPRRSPLARWKALPPDVRFLATSAVSAGFVVNAHRPSRAGGLLVQSFFASWLTNELAHVAMVAEPFLVANRVVKARRAGHPLTKSPAGVAGLALATASWLGTVRLVRGGFAAGGHASEALGELGADLPAHTPASRRNISFTRDVPFAEVDGTTLRLDVTAPSELPSPGERRPAVLQIHGGGWVIGDKREQGLPLLRLLASNGWVGFNANYRLSPKATFPEHLIDCKRALAWIKEHADEYGVDPDFVVVTGGSAGGHLTALMALTPNRPEYQPGFEAVDTTVAAAVPFYGIYDFKDRHGNWYTHARTMLLEPIVMKARLSDAPDRYAAASPLDQVNPDAPPFMVVHGDRDTLASVGDARVFVENLREVSHNDVVYLELPGAQHAFDVFRSPRTDRVLLGVLRFLTAVHTSYRAGSGGTGSEEDDGTAGASKVEATDAATDSAVG